MEDSGIDSGDTKIEYKNADDKGFSVRRSLFFFHLIFFFVLLFMAFVSICFNLFDCASFLFWKFGQQVAMFLF